MCNCAKEEEGYITSFNSIELNVSEENKEEDVIDHFQLFQNILGIIDVFILLPEQF